MFDMAIEAIIAPSPHVLKIIAIPCGERFITRVIHTGPNDPGPGMPMPMTQNSSTSVHNTGGCERA